MQANDVPPVVRIAPAVGVALVAGVRSVVGESGLLALFIRRHVALPESRFLTAPETEFQVGFIVHPEGHQVLPHRHVRMERRIEQTCEMLVVREGRCEVDVFDEHGIHAARETLEPGDTVLFLAGGHAVRMLQNCTLLEVKQGPYRGTAEKELL